MEFLTKKQLYSRILNILQKEAEENEEHPSLIGKKHGISRAMYYNIVNYLVGNKSEDELWSDKKLKEICKNMRISIGEVIYMIIPNGILSWVMQLTETSILEMLDLQDGSLTTNFIDSAKVQL